MLYRFLSGDFPIAIIILLTMAYWAWLHRSTVRELLFDPVPIWRWIGRITSVMVVVLPVWVAAADNLRQLLGYGVNVRVRWMSDAFETTPTPDALRLITFAILGISLLGAGALYAKRQNGLWILAGILGLSTVYFYFFNALRMRGDVFIRSTEGKLGGLSAVDLGFTLFWSFCFIAFLASVVAAAYLWLFSLIAMPMHVLYSLLTRGRRPIEAESQTIYGRLHPTTEPGGASAPAESMERE